MPKINLGDPAPPFALGTERGQMLRLDDALARGPVVLIFYPMDDTRGCTSQLCAVRDDAAKYAAAGVAVYGVNGGDAGSHQKFAAKYGFTAPLLVDAGLAVASAYDAVFGVGPFRLIKRTVVGVGRDGKVAFYRRGTPPTDDIIAALTGG